MQISKPLFFLGCLLALIGFSALLVTAPPAVAQAQSSQAGSSRQTTCSNLSNIEECQGLRTIDSVLNFMAILVVPLCGVLVTVAGIQYMVSRNNPEMASAARMRIYKVILALVSFLGLWAFLKWLLPGLAT